MDYIVWLQRTTASHSCWVTVNDFPEFSSHVGHRQEILWLFYFRLFNHRNGIKRKARSKTWGHFSFGTGEQTGLCFVQPGSNLTSSKTSNHDILIHKLPYFLKWSHFRLDNNWMFWLCVKQNYNRVCYFVRFSDLHSFWVEHHCSKYKSETIGKLLLWSKHVCYAVLLPSHWSCTVQIQVMGVAEWQRSPCYKTLCHQHDFDAVVFKVKKPHKVA